MFSICGVTPRHLSEVLSFEGGILAYFSYCRFSWNKLPKAFVVWMNDSRIHRNMKIAREDSAVKTRLLWLMWPSTLTHRKEYQSKLLVFYSKGGRCSFWGLLHCDDRRSPWWGNRDGLQHDRSCSNTVMIRINCKSYASLVVFFIIPDFFVLFCFFFRTRTYIYDKSGSCFLFLLP